ncbi:MAG: biopolymer transporter ExbD [Blastochloris viridis]|uniref:Biopolymer transporter ExbD n=1 Tax=Blastochloris viridis TaxID=1079 RepID=A0A6N4REY1_BLAVI|nr:MAG: biopolymer transporter ExbD [Blastochloris viridis]
MGMNMGPSGHKGHRVYKPVAEMNITPMVDVMLVLMIIFMVAAPMMTQGVQVALPKADAKSIEQEKPVEILLKKDGTVQIGSAEVARADLVARLQAIQEGRDSAAILLRADKDINYGTVMEIMAALQMAGMVDVGLVTEPTE